MKHFVISNMENEGSNAIIARLRHMPGVDTIMGEPFDRHMFMNKKTGGLGQHIAMPDLEKCLSIFFGGEASKEDKFQLKTFYQKYNSSEDRHKKLLDYSQRNARGFKKRLIWGVNAEEREIYFNTFQEHGVILFVLFRKDVFKWALSRYKGQHLQFDLIEGKLQKEDIPKQVYEPELLGKIIEKNLALHNRKHKLMADAKAKGITCYPLYYENFLHAPVPFFEEILSYLEIDHTKDSITRALQSQIKFRKVHSDNPKDMIANYDEIYPIFSDYLNDSDENFPV